MGSWWNDFKSNAVSGVSLKPTGNRTASQDGDYVDMKEAELGLFALLSTGAIADGTHNVKLTEADDASGTNDQDVNDFRTGIAAAFAELDSTGDDDKSVALTFKRSKRFVRLVTTVAGASTGGQYSGSIHGLRKSRSTDEDLS